MLYPNSWYPLCTTGEVKKGEVISREAFGFRLAIFRTVGNQLGLLESRCSHIGADLSRGHVDNDCLVCPLHNWSFNVQGECVHIPCTDKIPPKAGQRSLVCMEHYGVVYAYLGAKPKFPLPKFPDLNKYVISGVTTIDFDASYEMAVANSFDEQHLSTVHRRNVIGEQKISSSSDYNFSIEYRADITPHTIYDKILHMMGIKQNHMLLDCWGGNIMLFSHLGTRNLMIISLLPVGKVRTRAYITTVTTSGQGLVSSITDWLRVRLMHAFTMMFVSQDVKALQGMDFKIDNMLPVHDTTMLKWYQHWLKLPRKPAWGADQTSSTQLVSHGTKKSQVSSISST